MAQRFFVPPEQIHHQKFTLIGSEARHAALVLRKKVGDVIDFFDGKDLSYQGLECPLSVGQIC
jgi:16S rRNA U1498 N3-methylase RsmE